MKPKVSLPLLQKFTTGHHYNPNHTLVVYFPVIQSREADNPLPSGAMVKN